MPPNQLNNFTIAVRRLLDRFNINFKPSKRKLQFKSHPRTQDFNTKKPTRTNPFQTMFRDLSKSLSQVSKSFMQEDYSAVVKTFLPENSVLIKPQFPATSSRIQLAAIDGDSSKALISSYKLNDEIKTLVLKNQNGQWYKAAEINNSGHDTLNYRGFADITGVGRNQLLLGLTSKSNTPTLYGYSIENNTPKEMFKRQYNRFEVLKLSNNRSDTKSQLAIWEKKADETFNIEVHDWNGSQLDSVKNLSSYYLRRVVPYHAERIKQNPTISSNWYNLADALQKSGMKRDALTAVEAGLTFANNSEKKDKFLALKKEITAK